MLEVKGLQSGYGHLRVLFDVSLKVNEGEFVVLVGPNGAGKTTLLKTIVGLIPPTKGEICLMGNQIRGVPTHKVVRMGLAFITEHSNLFDGMSVRENLLLGAYGKSSETKRALIGQVMDLFPVLEERQKQLAGTLSGGERKMLALGRGLMSSPRLLLVDEPSIGLAPMLVESVFLALSRLRRSGTTILLVEQNTRASLQLADRGYVLEQGVIVQEGKGSDLLENSYVRRAYLGIE